MQTLTEWMTQNLEEAIDLKKDFENLTKDKKKYHKNTMQFVKGDKNNIVFKYADSSGEFDYIEVNKINDKLILKYSDYKGNQKTKEIKRLKDWFKTYTPFTMDDFHRLNT